MREAEERLCERFDELKPGMIVIAKRCAWCGGGSHRVMLTSFYRGPMEAIEGQVDGGGWLTQPAPPPPCSNQAGYVVSAYGVRLGKVYIVETGNDNDAEREEGRRLEKVIAEGQSEPNPGHQPEGSNRPPSAQNNKEGERHG